MSATLVATALGTVEVEMSGTGADVVLFFPGGHTSARTPLGQDLYTALGFRVLTFSRPGYGRTSVGASHADAFAGAVDEVCRAVDVRAAAATVGVSFGGLQACAVAARLPRLAPRLILHSCAPSRLAYPDGALERVLAPVLFGQRTQRAVWGTVRALVRSDRGLRMMMSSLTTLPMRRWWPTWSRADRAAARATFMSMGSDAGFTIDLAQSTGAGTAARAALLRAVACPTLVTASPHDGGVDIAHAHDFVRALSDARFVETDAPSHFGWIGAAGVELRDTVERFLRDQPDSVTAKRVSAPR